MIRAGTSWPGSHGRRYWVSGPLWLLTLGGWLSWPFDLAAWCLWIFIGWWLVLGIGGLLAVCWLLAQLILILASAAVMIWAFWSNVKHRTRYRGRVMRLPFGLFAIDQTESNY